MAIPYFASIGGASSYASLFSNGQVTFQGIYKMLLVCCILSFIYLFAIGDATSLPLIASTDRDSASHLNDMSHVLYELEAESTVQLINRMSAEANIGTSRRDNEDVQASMRKYKKHVEAFFNKSSNQTAGFIMPLVLKDNPPLRDLKPLVAVPDRASEKVSRMVLVAKRLYKSTDARIATTRSEDFNFSNSYQLCHAEYNWLKDIVETDGKSCMEPTKNAQIANDWHYLPVNRILCPEVCLLIHCAQNVTSFFS